MLRKANVVFGAIAVLGFIFVAVEFYRGAVELYRHLADRRAEAAWLVRELRVGRRVKDLPPDLLERLSICGPRSEPYAAKQGLTVRPGTVLMSYCRSVSCAYVLADGDVTTGTIVQVAHYIT